MQCAALRRHHVGVHAPLSVEATIIIYDTGRIHAHASILSASCTPVNVRSVPLCRRSRVAVEGPLCGTKRTLTRAANCAARAKGSMAPVCQEFCSATISPEASIRRAAAPRPVCSRSSWPPLLGKSAESRRASRPRHHVPTCRCGGVRADSLLNHSSDPPAPISANSSMDTASTPTPEGTRLDQCLRVVFLTGIWRLMKGDGRSHKGP